MVGEYKAGLSEEQVLSFFFSLFLCLFGWLFFGVIYITGPSENSGLVSTEPWYGRHPSIDPSIILSA